MPSIKVTFICSGRCCSELILQYLQGLPGLCMRDLLKSSTPTSTTHTGTQSYPTGGSWSNLHTQKHCRVCGEGQLHRALGQGPCGCPLQAGDDLRVLHGTGDPELKEKNGISTAGPVYKVGGITTINQPQEQNGATGICGYG